MEHIFETSMRTLVGFTVLLILTRLLGKKQMGQLTIFTYITGIAMGNIAGDMVVHKDIKLSDGITGLSVWALLTVITELISLKSSKARVLLDGEPTIIIKKGVIMQKELAVQRLNMDDLTMLLRTNNVFSIRDVDYAILEPNGQLSVLKKPALDSITKSDMNITVANRAQIPAEIIVDGKLVKDSLRQFNLDANWLDVQLIQAGIHSIKDVFYAELQTDGSLYICKENQHYN